MYIIRVSVALIVLIILLILVLSEDVYPYIPIPLRGYRGDIGIYMLT